MVGKAWCQEHESVGRIASIRPSGSEVNAGAQAAWLLLFTHSGTQAPEMVPLHIQDGSSP